MSLLEYYTGFRSILGALATVVTALPLVTALLPDRIASFAFPPLGDFEPIARIGTVGSVALTTYVVYFLRSRKVSVCVLTASTLAIVLFVGYLAASFLFVRKIDIPAQKTAVFVSVGYDRTVFATKAFSEETDWEMLRDRGLSDEAIKQLWTSKSILIARLLALWLSFSGSLIFVVAALGFGIINQQHRNGTVPTP